MTAVQVILDFRRPHAILSMTADGKKVDSYSQDGKVYAWSESNCRFEWVPGLKLPDPELALGRSAFAPRERMIVPVEAKATIYRGELSARQHELLKVLAEEAGEIVVAVSKLLRFGPDNWDPREFDVAKRMRNAIALGREVGQLRYVSDHLTETGLYDITDVDRGAQDKHEKLERWLFSSPHKEARR